MIYGLYISSFLSFFIVFIVIYILTWNIYSTEVLFQKQTNKTKNHKVLNLGETTSCFTFGGIWRDLSKSTTYDKWSQGHKTIKER